MSRLAQQGKQILIFCKSHGRVLDLAAVINDILNGSSTVEEKDWEENDGDANSRSETCHTMSGRAAADTVLAPAFARLSCNLSDTVASREDTLGVQIGESTVQRVFARILYGDMNQAERMDVVSAFRKKKFQILVATDVAARGLDIPHISIVRDMSDLCKQSFERVGSRNKDRTSLKASAIVCSGVEL